MSVFVNKTCQLECESCSLEQGQPVVEADLANASEFLSYHLPSTNLQETPLDRTTSSVSLPVDPKSPRVCTHCHRTIRSSAELPSPTTWTNSKSRIPVLSPEKKSPLILPPAPLPYYSPSTSGLTKIPMFPSPSIRRQSFPDKNPSPAKLGFYSRGSSPSEPTRRYSLQNRFSHRERQLGKPGKGSFFYSDMSLDVPADIIIFQKAIEDSSMKDEMKEQLIDKLELLLRLASEHYLKRTSPSTALVSTGTQTSSSAEIESETVLSDRICTSDSEMNGEDRSLVGSDAESSGFSPESDAQDRAAVLAEKEEVLKEEERASQLLVTAVGGETEDSPSVASPAPRCRHRKQSFDEMQAFLADEHEILEMERDDARARERLYYELLLDHGLTDSLPPMSARATAATCYPIQGDSVGPPQRECIPVLQTVCEEPDHSSAAHHSSLPPTSSSPPPSLPRTTLPADLHAAVVPTTMSPQEYGSGGPPATMVNKEAVILEEAENTHPSPLYDISSTGPTPAADPCRPKTESKQEMLVKDGIRHETMGTQPRIVRKESSTGDNESAVSALSQAAPEPTLGPVRTKVKTVARKASTTKKKTVSTGQKQNAHLQEAVGSPVKSKTVKAKSKTKVKTAKKSSSTSTSNARDIEGKRGSDVATKKASVGKADEGTQLKQHKKPVGGKAAVLGLGKRKKNSSVGRDKPEDSLTIFPPTTQEIGEVPEHGDLPAWNEEELDADDSYCPVSSGSDNEDFWNEAAAKDGEEEGIRAGVAKQHEKMEKSLEKPESYSKIPKEGRQLQSSPNVQPSPEGCFENQPLSQYPPQIAKEDEAPLEGTTNAVHGQADNVSPQPRPSLAAEEQPECETPIRPSEGSVESHAAVHGQDLDVSPQPHPSLAAEEQPECETPIHPSEGAAESHAAVHGQDLDVSPQPRPSLATEEQPEGETSIHASSEGSVESHAVHSQDLDVSPQPQPCLPGEDEPSPHVVTEDETPIHPSSEGSVESHAVHSQDLDVSPQPQPCLPDEDEPSPHVVTEDETLTQPSSEGSTETHAADHGQADDVSPQPQPSLAAEEQPEVEAPIHPSSEGTAESHTAVHGQAHVVSPQPQSRVAAITQPSFHSSSEAGEVHTSSQVATDGSFGSHSQSQSTVENQSLATPELQDITPTRQSQGAPEGHVQVVPANHQTPRSQAQPSSVSPNEDHTAAQPDSRNVASHSQSSPAAESESLSQLPPTEGETPPCPSSEGTAESHTAVHVQAHGLSPQPQTSFSGEDQPSSPVVTETEGEAPTQGTKGHTAAHPHPQVAVEDAPQSFCAQFSCACLSRAASEDEDVSSGSHAQPLLSSQHGAGKKKIYSEEEESDDENASYDSRNELAVIISRARLLQTEFNQDSSSRSDLPPDQRLPPRAFSSSSSSSHSLHTHPRKSTSSSGLNSTPSYSLSPSPSFTQEGANGAGKTVQTPSHPAVDYQRRRVQRARDDRLQDRQALERKIILLQNTVQKLEYNGFEEVQKLIQAKWAHLLHLVLRTEAMVVNPVLTPEKYRHGLALPLESAFSSGKLLGWTEGWNDAFSYLIHDNEAFPAGFAHSQQTVLTTTTTTTSTTTATVGVSSTLPANSEYAPLPGP